MKTFVTLRAEDEKFSRVEKQDAIFKVHQHFFVSTSPRMYAMILHDKDPLLEYVRRTSTFVVNFVEDEKKMELIEAEKVFCKMIENAEHLECEVVQEIQVGDSHALLLAEAGHLDADDSVTASDGVDTVNVAKAEFRQVECPVVFRPSRG